MDGVTILRALEAVGGFLLEHPMSALPVGIAAVVGIVLGGPAGGSCSSRDPRRVFTAAERRAAFERAGLRCEHKAVLWSRCTNTPTQADHIYPWARGGRTSMSNLQALCAFHNNRKSDSVPSRFYILRLQARRRRYFPPGEAPRVEWRQGATR